MRARASRQFAPSAPRIFAGRVPAERLGPDLHEGAAMNEGAKTSRGAGLDPIETASRDEITALQFGRLQWSLEHAYTNVGHYRAAFDRVGVHPRDMKSLADLAAYPFLVKNHLREHYPFGLFAVPRESIARIHASSGTTGKPTVVGYTRNDIDTWAGLVARSIHAAGGRAGQIAHIAYGYGLFTGGLGAHYGAERLGLSVAPMSGGQTEKQVQLIQDFRPDLILVTPSYMLTIAEEFERQGLDCAASSLKIGIFGAEPGATRCARRSSDALASMRSTSMAFPRSWGRESRASASSRRTGRSSGKTTSTRRSSTPRRARCCRTASSCSPR